MFTPYHIHCVTCNATLKVGREGLIGEILTCPRCHSMVKVEADAPRGNSAGGGMEATSNATTSNATTSNATDTSQRANSRGVLAPPIQIPPLPEEKTDSNSPPTELSIPRLPAAPKTAWPPWLVLTTAAIVGALLAGFIWAFFKDGITSHPLEQKNTTNVNTPGVLKHPTHKTEPLNGKPIQQARTKEVQPTDNVSDPLPNSSSDIPQAGQEPKTPPAVHATRSKIPTQQSEQHPADPGRQISSPPSEESEQAKLPAKPDNNQNVTAKADLQKTQHVPLPDPSPETAARLNVEIERIHFEDVALDNALDLIAQLTGISITIDDAALLDRGLSRDSRIQFTAEQDKASEVLTSLLTQVDLSFIATGDEIIITGAKPNQ